MSKDSDEHIRRMMQAAFDDAFKMQIGLLFKTYLSNVTSVGDKQREFTRNGVNNAIAAYRLATDAVKEWKG